MIRITHFRSKCIGCNACVEANFERWRISKKDGKCILVSGVKKIKRQPLFSSSKKVKKKTLDGEEFFYVGSDFEYEANKLAARNCPVRIIRVEKT